MSQESTALVGRVSVLLIKSKTQRAFLPHFFLLNFFRETFSGLQRLIPQRVQTQGILCYHDHEATSINSFMGSFSRGLGRHTLDGAAISHRGAARI